MDALHLVNLSDDALIRVKLHFIDSDKGLTVKLPPMPDGPILLSEINKRNVLNILVNNKDELMVNNQLTELSELRNIAKTFVTNPLQEEDKPVNPRKAVISLKNDEGTTYQTYLTVHNEIKAVYGQLWNKIAQIEFEENYELLTMEQRKQVREIYPYRISEAEPIDE